jgi:thioredoxin 1
MNGKKHFVVDVTANSKVKDRCSVIKLSASWCGPCKVAKPWFLERAKEYSDVVDCYEVDVDDYPEGLHPLFDKLTESVRSLPTWHFVFDGEVKKTLTGFGDSAKDKLSVEFKELAKLQEERRVFDETSVNIASLLVTDEDEMIPSDASVTLAAVDEDGIFDLDYDTDDVEGGGGEEVRRNLAEFVKKTAMYFSKEENTKRRRDIPRDYDQDVEGETLDHEDGCIETMDISSKINDIISSMGSFKNNQPRLEVFEV